MNRPNRSEIMRRALCEISATCGDLSDAHNVARRALDEAEAEDEAEDTRIAELERERLEACDALGLDHADAAELAARIRISKADPALEVWRELQTANARIAELELELASALEGAEDADEAADVAAAYHDRDCERREGGDTYPCTCGAA